MTGGWERLIIVAMFGPLHSPLLTKIAGILLLQGSLAALVGIALWSVFAGRQAENYSGASDEDFDDEGWD